MSAGKETRGGVITLLPILKNLIGISDDTKDELLDKKLAWILESAKARLKLLIGGIEPPEDMEHIIIEVSVIRYNRIGSEGTKAHSVEGESQNFNENDFDGFMEEIQSFLDMQKEARRGKVRFL